jgi:DNA-binding ferritin-like protein
MAAHAVAAARTRSCCCDDIAANDGGDAGVNDLASALSAKHAKMAWKLRSALGPSAEN